MRDFLDRRRAGFALIVTFAAWAARAQAGEAFLDPWPTAVAKARAFAADAIGSAVAKGLWDGADPAAKDWLTRHGAELAQELRDAPLRWSRDDSAHCAATGNARGDAITFYANRCLAARITWESLAELLIHETVHHFGFRDDAGEAFADAVAITVMETWREKRFSALPRSHAWEAMSDTPKGESRGTVQGTWAPKAQGRPGEGTLYVGGGVDEDKERMFGTWWAYDPGRDAWRSLPTAGAPSPRLSHTQAWVDGALLVWGGCEMVYWDPSLPGLRHGKDDGALYDPATDRWKAMSRKNAPSPRCQHSSVWTGRELLVWGGGRASADALSPMVRESLADGGRYDPKTDVWQALTADGAPTRRTHHAAVWTGEEMIVWGGVDASEDGMGSFRGDGAAFNPRTGKWRPLATQGAPEARAFHSMVWTGREVFIWGGIGEIHDEPSVGTDGYMRDGAAYDPVTDTWRPIASRNAPSPREGQNAAWTGAYVVILGGRTYGDVTTMSGGFYDPVNDAWTAVSTAGAPGPRGDAALVWTGDSLLMWGGTDRRSLKPALAAGRLRLDPKP